MSRGVEKPTRRPSSAREARPPQEPWEKLRDPVAFSTGPGGDWRSYAHLASKRAWKEAMQPRCEEFEPLKADFASKTIRNHAKAGSLIGP